MITKKGPLTRICDLAGSIPIVVVTKAMKFKHVSFCFLTDLNCIGDSVVEATTNKQLKYA